MKNSIKQQKREKEASVVSSVVHTGKMLKLRVDNATYDDSTSRDIDVLEHPGASLIIPVLPSGNIIFIKQYRRAIDKILTELPAGTLEPKEEPIVCASRELEEETGYKAKNIIPLSGFFPAPGFCNEYIHIFIASDLYKGKMNLDADEGIDPIELTLDEALKMINKNIIVDTKTIAALFKYMMWKKVVL